MALQPGTRIGPYDITAQIGAGGMGEVYRARDAPLGRDVAIKVLPEAVAHDPDRLARFDREAKTLAALNHPNIAQIYGLETGAGVRAVVMELVEGPTLADRLAQGPIPVDEALPIAKQIAEAFEAAHEQAIVHRDLKPANVKVRADGVVKVLDFGLAKAMEPPATASSGVSQPPTITTPAMTRAGMILGTAAYMSPEQARGKPVDRRADIWAFGCVLYEMLSGRRAFPGEEIADVLAAVLRQDIEWTALPSGTPPRLRRLLERCLDRDVKQRLRDIGEARVEIGKIESGAPETASVIARTPERGRGRERVAWALVATLVLATAALSLPAARYLRGPAPAAPARFPIETPPMLNANASSVTVSPDGRTVAYVAASEGGKSQLFVRPIDSLVAKPLAGTEGAQYPFWSPDSRYIAFSVGQQAESVLKKIEAAGSPPQDICAMGGNGTWNADDVIVFANRGLHRVPAAGGQPTRLTTPDASLEETGHAFPYFLPDGRHFLYVAVSLKPESRALYVGALDSNQKTRVMPSESKVVYVAPGFLVFHRQGTLLAQRFDATRLTPQGEPIRLAEDVIFRSAGTAAFAASQTGTLVYRSGAWTEPAQLTWFDREGRRLASVGGPGPFRTFALSPDEKTVVLQRFEPGSSRGDLWTLEISTRILSPLTTDPADDNEPVWSPDSRTVMFAKGRTNTYELFQRTLGSREDVRVFGSPDGAVWPDDWSRDGRYILINDRNRGILAVPTAGEGKPITLLQSGPRSIVDEAQFSPDSRWVAYASSESGTTQIYVAPFPEFKPIKQVSANGGNEPHWSRDGKELFYLTTDGQLLAVGVRTAGAELKTTPPTKLFDTRVTTTTPWSQVYAPSNDGGRFLVLNTVQDSRPTPITVVLNWTTGLK